MMNLAEYRRRSQSLADFLPWAALVREGVILNKDGSFQRTARFRGPDLDSATPAELVAITARLNNALRRLGSGWAIFIEAQRHPANRYPESRFPDPASGLVDAERRAQFEEEGAHYESGYFLTLVWLPPADDAARAEAWLYEGGSREGADWRAALVGFIDRTDRVLALIEGLMPEACWLDDPDTLTYLHSCVSTRRQRVRVPETPMHLDAILVDEDLTGGLEPRLGRAHLRTLTIMGFPSQTCQAYRAYSQDSPISHHRNGTAHRALLHSALYPHDATRLGHHLARRRQSRLPDGQHHSGRRSRARHMVPACKNRRLKPDSTGR